MYFFPTAFVYNFRASEDQVKFEKAMQTYQDEGYFDKPVIGSDKGNTALDQHYFLVTVNAYHHTHMFPNIQVLLMVLVPL